MLDSLLDTAEEPLSEAQPAARSEPVSEQLNEVGLWVFTSRHADAFQMDFTRHRFLKLLLITSGSGIVQGDWGELDCKMGDLVLVPAGLRHRIVDHPRQPISLYGVGIALKLLRCVPSVRTSLPSGVLRADQLAPLRLEQRMRRLMYAHTQSHSLYRLASIAAALDLVAQVSLVVADGRAELQCEQPLKGPQHGPQRAHSEDPVDPLLESYLAWLQHNFFECQSLDDAANACGMSRRSFTSAFRKRTGKTWLDYVNRLRARHAIELLQSSDAKMTSIAFRSGFDDLSTFYRVIRRVAGVQPGALRRRES